MSLLTDLALTYVLEYAGCLLIPSLKDNNMVSFETAVGVKL
jgi:hypothetical protein